MRMRLSFVLCAFFSFFIFLEAGPANAATPAPNQKVPTTINADRMDYDANGQTVLFTGNVHVKRPDFELWSKKMTVYLDKSTAQQNPSNDSADQGMEAGDIDRIVAEEDVRMKSEGRTGTCKKATYYAKEDKFVMEGNPVLKDDKQSTVTGRKVVHYLSTNKSHVLDGATVNFYAPDKTGNGGGTPERKNGGKQ